MAKHTAAPRLKRDKTERVKINDVFSLKTDDRNVDLSAVMEMENWKRCIPLLDAVAELRPTATLSIFFRSDKFREYANTNRIVVSVPTNEYRFSVIAHELTHLACHSRWRLSTSRREFEACSFAEEYANQSEKEVLAGRNYVGQKIGWGFRSGGRRFDREAWDYALWDWFPEPTGDVDIVSMESTNWSAWKKLTQRQSFDD